MSEQKRLSELMIGDYVEEAYNEKQQLLVSNFPIHDQSDLNRLREIGVETCSVKPGGALGKGDSPRASHPSEEDQSALAEPGEDAPLISQARSTYRNTLEQLEDLLSIVHQDHQKAAQLNELKPFVEQFIDYIETFPASVSCLTQIQQFDESNFQHSVNVSLLALLYGHREGFEQDLLLKFGFGALVHDIGKTKLSREILGKEGPLTEREQSILELHPGKGRDILKAAGFSEAVQKIAFQHHRRQDGSGYPEDSTTEMHPLATIVSVIDEYERLLSARSGQNQHPVKVYSQLKKQFYDSNETRTILNNLIQFLGLFPVGSLVQLSNDDIAVVMENKTDNLRHPLVTVLGSEDEGALNDVYEVDLEDIRHQKRVVNDKLYDDEINIERVLDYSRAPNLSHSVPELIEKHHLPS